jgi:hypothetical protein
MTPIALAFILLAVALHATDQQQSTFRSGAELVRIEAHVVARESAGWAYACRYELTLVGMN